MLCRHLLEFDQLDHVLNLATSPEDYLSIVRGKTAGPFRLDVMQQRTCSWIVRRKSTRSQEVRHGTWYCFPIGR